ncbi:alpha beta hydrolase fold protein [Ophiostoma piceae UAMH 11346]|uniref:Alpha beta hydrolase fold protein n=1 Tax=Ophiostoma piceae (strain UAMH 11346) TaxID=1262450 RepID=S3CT92_OPHP1|nr:alpha beta hydrolase fold protein [Ophiostoma piceae UAMH 11346]
MAETPIPITPLHPPFSWSDRIKFALGGYALYTLGKLGHYLYRLKGLFGAPANGPDLVKRYACRPMLEVLFFYPPSYDKAAGPEKQKLPTLLTIHGGGFVIGNPEDTNTWNHEFVRQKHETFVVSLNYRKAPRHPFPTAIHDLEALTLAILGDKSLPIDLDQVAIGGWSAGGNLAMAVSSLPSMQGRFRALVPVYPVTDFSIRTPEKILTRHYKPDIKGFRGRLRDFLSPVVPTFNWAYLPKNATPADVASPLLSTTHIPKESLPLYVFNISCELDMLSHEAWVMMSKLAGRPVPAEPKSGSSEAHAPGALILDDERFAFEERTENSSYKWLLVPDALHGFDMTFVHRFKKDPLYEDHMLKKGLCMALINEWLFSGPFKA